MDQLLVRNQKPVPVILCLQATDGTDGDRLDEDRERSVIRDREWHRIEKTAIIVEKSARITVRNMNRDSFLGGKC